MALPQLIQEDIEQLKAALSGLLAKSEASLALVADKGGFRLAEFGVLAGADTTALASLSAGSFLATQAIAQQIGETSFNTVYQQGEKLSLLVINVDEYSVLIIIFPANVSVGAVKYFASGTIELISTQLHKAKERSPNLSVDPALLNLTGTTELFTRRPT